MRTQNVSLAGKTVLVTGAAGFIGAYLARSLLGWGEVKRVVGMDNLNDYYDVELKRQRLRWIESAAEKSASEWVFVRDDIARERCLEDLFAQHRFSVAVNLAAQAGVRYSIDHPDVYIESNLIGFYRLLEACRHNPVEHLVYASSSSVYGANSSIPYSVGDRTDEPVSLYAATKKSNEMLAHAYAKLYDIPSTGLRFFTVYGPAGRIWRILALRTSSHRGRP